MARERNCKHWLDHWKNRNFRQHAARASFWHWKSGKSNVFFQCFSVNTLLDRFFKVVLDRFSIFLYHSKSVLDFAVLSFCHFRGSLSSNLLPIVSEFLKNSLRAFSEICFSYLAVEQKELYFISFIGQIWHRSMTGKELDFVGQFGWEVSFPKLKF